MKFLQKASLLLLIMMALAPLAATGAGTGESEDLVVNTHHNEMCMSLNASSYDTHFMEVTLTLEEEMLDSILAIDFVPEVSNITQNGANASLDDFTFEWTYFTTTNTTQTTETGDHFSHELPSVTSETTVFVSLLVEDKNGDTFEGICLDLAFETHEQAVHHAAEEEGNLLGNLILSLLIVLVAPGILLWILNRFL